MTSEAILAEFDTVEKIAALFARADGRLAPVPVIRYDPGMDKSTVREQLEAITDPDERNRAALKFIAVPPDFFAAGPTVDYAVFANLVANLALGMDNL